MLLPYYLALEHIRCINGFTIPLKASTITTTKLCNKQFVRSNSENIRVDRDSSLCMMEEDTEDIEDNEDNTIDGEMESAAKEWMEQQKEENVDEDIEETTDDSSTPSLNYIVVGGGWGGWGAAKALCESGLDCEVTLIDALPDPTGATPYLSKTGKPVEAGTRGFWKDYPNINALCAQLNINEDDVFTPFTNSSFYSPDGLEATAPVFSEAKVSDLLPFDLPLPSFLSSSSDSSSTTTSSFLDETFPQLPSPLGQVLATSTLFERIPLEDRASMVGLLLATIDCLGGDETVQEQYDRMTAHDLFIRFKLSKRLVDDFIRPTLLVGLFKPPEELSALVVMELLYYYALAHQDSFDVRWIKNGTVSDSLIAPLATMLENDYDLNVLGGCRVNEIVVEKSEDGEKLQATKLSYQKDGEMKTIDNIDGVILALGCKGMESVVKNSPTLARLPTFSKAASLKGIDVISTRIWLDKVVPTRTPANVFAKFDELRGSGGTFFMLDQLQGNSAYLWGEEDDEKVQGSVIAADFYNAGAVMSLSDDDIIKVLMEDLLPSAVSQFADANVVDSWVGKYPGTVSWFSPGSYTSRPPLEGAGNAILPNVKCAGDWVRMGEREHGAKGLCQERAYVSGMEAANSLMKSTATKKSSVAFSDHVVLPVREDEEQFKLGVSVNNQVMKFLPRFWVR